MTRVEIGAGITEVICYGTAVSVEQALAEPGNSHS